MNKNKLKAYAQTARREFIQAVTERSHFYGLKEKGTDPCEVKGDFAIINGRAFPKQVDEQRSALEEQVNRKGFCQVMEEVAYTWFNRFAAIRYMELHGFLSHGYRVLSHPVGNSTPEILEKAQHVELTGLDKEEVINLKMDGTKDEELYSKLLIAECNELSKIMPFLFEHVADYTELLIPGNLLHSDSLIRKMVSEIVEEDWQEIEIIGWLYQFYISEKKDEVIGKVVKSEDIPAATQLFTPNWIVKYLVQNSIGAQWMRTYPESTIKSKMEYYIEPAEQTDEVNAKIKEITLDSLNYEELTILDPACGSGHILVEAYDLLKEIYLERGYRKRDIPELILAKNLYGLEIDDRATQLAGFALMMKARGDDRNIFDKNIQPNILSIQESKGIKTGNGFEDLVNLFEHAKTYGSLIRVPEELANKLPEIRKKIEEGRQGLNKQDLWTGSQYYERLLSLVSQAEIMSRKYDSVVANPPYMGKKGMNALIKEFARQEYPDAKSDLFAMFVERGFELVKQEIGCNAMVTMHSWMFLLSYEKMRRKIIDNRTFFNMAHLGARAFSTISGEVVTVTSFSIMEGHFGDYKPSFLRLVDGDEESKLNGLKNKVNRFNNMTQNDFKKIPGLPIAYWVSERVREVFIRSQPIGEISSPRQGLATNDNSRFLRLWPEVSQGRAKYGSGSRKEALESGTRWFPYNKGGPYRKWYGNLDHLVNWENDGSSIKERKAAELAAGRVTPNNSKCWNESHYFRESITWSALSSGSLSLRYCPVGSLFDTKGQCIFSDEGLQKEKIMALLNSAPCLEIMKFLAPTLDFNSGVIAKVPFVDVFHSDISLVERLVSIAKEDWDAYERSWEFQSIPILTASSESAPTLESSYAIWITQNRNTIAEMKRFEEENNCLFIDAYNLAEELTPDVPINQITLTVNPAYRYGGKLTEGKQWASFRQDTMEELISYAIGCMMGRYSLDQKGLVYAHAGNEGFDHNKYKTFPADDDGIIPITDHEWFDDDAACRFFRFIETAWNKDTLEDNLEFVADAIGRITNESSRDSIRRYFVNGFYRDHLETYKKRPIYWLFTSGKERAFQALVYLHRYNEGTLSRMRTEYVLPLQNKMTTRMEHLKEDKDHATSTSAANKIQKEIGRLRKQKEELLKFDENLHHYADKKISLDLDDGVKVNYGKFGDLLAEVKAVTGKK